MAEGESGGKKIERLAKGDKTRTARHASVMNELIDKVNLLLAMTVSPMTKGKFIFSDANVVLDASKFGGEIEVAQDDFDDFPEGETFAPNVTKITFSELFKIHYDVDSRGVQVDLKTEECVCDDGTVDGGTL
jgi:hypothetical protein